MAKRREAVGQGPVSLRRVEDIAIVTIDNPPVNAMSHAVRSHLGEVFAALSGDAALRGVVIACAGRTFVAGADISEFGTPKQKEPPLLTALGLQIEAMTVPVVAALHGTALGGGLELALACHHRVVDEKAKLGVPEVTLGIMPGAGGTMRLPRLIGPMAALEMIVTGAPVGAQKALDLGLADRVSSGDPIDAALTFLRGLDRTAGAPKPVRERDEKLAATRQDPMAFEVRAAQLLAKKKGLRAPAACVDAVRNAFTLPADQALARERRTFLDLVAGLESKALRHLFFAEREAMKVPGIGKDNRPRDIGRVGVIGAGTMGGGIAMTFANAGYPVTVLETSDAGLARGFGMIEKNYAASVARGSLTAADQATRVALMTPTTDHAALADCDLIVEAVFEDLAVKTEVFARLSTLAKPGAILATNTSYLDVNAIAVAAGARAADVVGLHFFSPANVMKLLEIVCGKETAPDVIATALSVARRIGKIPVVVGVCHGFVGNRMLAARGAENEALLLEGATPEQIDHVFTDFGWPMGPFQMGDLAGLDIGWRNRKAQGKRTILADALCEAGAFGQKSGSGWYAYATRSRTPSHNPAVDELIAAAALERGIARRTIDPSEIQERTLLPMINEGARILEEGIASRASDIDLVWVNGYGFPAGNGGPMFWARHQRAIDIAGRLDHWFAVSGREVFRRSAALDEILGGVA